MALLLELAVGLGWLLEFVESSRLELLSVFKIWLKILGMFILPILQLSAGLFLLTCIALCVWAVGGSTANRNGICQEYNNEMIN